MANAYVKPKKQKKRLERRIKEFESTVSRLNPQQQRAYTKPGSQSK